MKQNLRPAELDAGKIEMKAKIEIVMDNAAFNDEPATELARILRELAEEIENGQGSCQLRDINGNAVGTFTVKGNR